MASQDQATKDAATKQRIISHMNADHQISLSYYLRHYSKLSSREASSPTMTDISFTSMTIQTPNKKTHTIPFSPPMASWAEARTRTVDMDRESRAALDISNILITSYEPPSQFGHLFIGAICLLAMGSWALRSVLVPGNVVYENVLRWFPFGGAAGYMKAANFAGPFTLVLHGGETFLLDRLRLRKHGVKRGSKVWWFWMGSCVVEGFACFQRIDGTVARKKAEAEKAKH